MKKSVVVIDDKPIIRRSIVQTIDWERLGCEVVGQAGDGNEGLALLAERLPDIVVTDIHMPGQSGLQLAEWMRAHLPESKTILFTGYQEFEFAKQAVKLGVFDFIVKPFQNAELTRVIERAVEEIDAERRQGEQAKLLLQEVTRLEMRHASSLRAMRSLWFEQQTEGRSEGPEESRRRMEELRIVFCRYALLAFRPTLEKSSEGAEWRERQEEMAELAVRLCERDGLDAIPGRRGGDLVIACLWQRVPAVRETGQKLAAIAEEWIREAERTTGLSFRAAYSSVYRSVQEMQEAYLEASKLLDSGFFHSEESVLSAKHGQGERGRARTKSSIMQDIEKYEKSIESMPFEEVAAETERIVEQIRLYAEGNITVAKGLVSEICLAAARYYFRTTGDELGLGRSVDLLLEDIYGMSSLKEASDYMTELVLTIRGKLKGEEKGYSLIVKNILEYLQAHYAEPLTLSSVANRFGISASYVSRLLRLETGINFVDLVARARIEAAKRLLRDPKYKVNEVGEIVGYPDYSYFYQVFKRVEGCSPKEFKNQSRNN